MQRSVPNKTSEVRKNDARAIVDPTAWESSEGVGIEAIVLAKRAVGKNKVSSIRSSLFKKNAKSIAAQFNEQNAVNERTPIFQNEEEAAALQAPFTFEGNSALKFCEYGKENKKAWAKDILALVHNAIRSELKDLTTILYSAQKLGSKLRIADFTNIRNWWNTCSALVLDFLDLEMKHLLPWFENAIENAKKPDDGARSCVENMPVRQKELRDLLMSISKSFGDICDLPVINNAKTNQQVSLAKKAMLIVNSLDALISQVCEYMNQQDNQLPVMLSSFYKSEKKEREAITAKIIRYIAKVYRKSDTMFVLLTRWMPDSKLAKAFTKTIQEIHECNYSSMQTQFEMNHAGFIHQFSVKAEL